MPPDIAEIEHVPAWETEDYRAFQAFLKTPTGAKLILSARRLTVSTAFEAINTGGSNPAYACGHAAGVYTVVAWLDALAKTQVAEPQKDEKGPDDGLGWMRDGNED